VRDRKDAPDVVGAVAQDQPAARALGSHVGGSEHPEACRVNEVQRCDVEDDVAGPLLESLVEDTSYLGDVAHVEVSLAVDELYFAGAVVHDAPDRDALSHPATHHLKAKGPTRSRRRPATSPNCNNR
jgi:hypothetical protein